MDKAFFHIAGLLEKYPIISTLLDIYQNERFKFIPYVEISGVYGCNKSKWGSGIIEKIYANDYGDFSYDIRTIKKDGEPSNIIIHANTWDKIYKA